MKSKRTWILALVASSAAALVLLVLITTVTAGQRVADVGASEVPSEFTYQGQLVDPVSHQPVADGKYTMVFTIYNARVGGNPLWTQTFSGTSAIPVIDGLFTAYLGSPLNPITPDMFPGDMRWLGMSVDGDPEMVPRTRFSSVPYALRAEMLRPGGTTNGDMPSTLYKFYNPDADGRALVSDGNFHVTGDAYVEGTLSWYTRTGRIAIPAAAFRPATPTQEFENYGAFLIADTSGKFSAPVLLPDGSRVTKMVMWYGDTNDNAHITAYLHLFRHENEFIWTMSDLESVNGSHVVSDTDIQRPLIENNVNSYHIYLSFSNLSGSTDTTDLRFRSIIIEYEYTKPH